MGAKDREGLQSTKPLPENFIPGIANIDLEQARAFVQGRVHSHQNPKDTFWKGNPYDQRTKTGRAWKLGWCHAKDERNLFFFPLPNYCNYRSFNITKGRQDYDRK